VKKIKKIVSACSTWANKLGVLVPFEQCMQAPLRAKHRLPWRLWKSHIEIFKCRQWIKTPPFSLFSLAKHKSIFSFVFYIQLIIIFLFYFVLLIFFFNLVPHHLVLFIFYIKFCSHSFNCYLFIFILFSNWILFSISSLSIWFWFIFMSNLISFLFIDIF